MLFLLAVLVHQTSVTALYHGPSMWPVLRFGVYLNILFVVLVVGGSDERGEARKNLNWDGEIRKKKEIRNQKSPIIYYTQHKRQRHLSLTTFLSKPLVFSAFILPNKHKLSLLLYVYTLLERTTRKRREQDHRKQYFFRDYMARANREKLRIYRSRCRKTYMHWSNLSYYCKIYTIPQNFLSFMKAVETFQKKNIYSANKKECQWLNVFFKIVSESTMTAPIR